MKALRWTLTSLSAPTATEPRRQARAPKFLTHPCSQGAMQSLGGAAQTCTAQ